MTYSAGAKLKFEAVKTVAYTSVGATYAVLGTALSHEASIIILTNATDKDVYISFDGSNDHIYLAAAQSLTINVEGNKATNGKLVLAKGTQIYQKRGPGGAGSSGNLFAMIGYVQ